MIHNFISSRKGTHGKPSPDYLSVSYEVSFYIKNFLCTAKSQPETGHHLIKNK